MSFSDLAQHRQAVTLLQRSLERGRLGHAYLFTGESLPELEQAARTLAKTLNCQSPPRRGPQGLALDCCDRCLVCRQIDGDIHADVQWIRPESKTRVVKIEQIRELLQTVHLKATSVEFKVAVIAGADRLNPNAANAFLKTLEEPPAKSVHILLSTEPQRLLETILSRCLRLNFGGDAAGLGTHVPAAWLAAFAQQAAPEQKGLLNRYRLLGILQTELARLKKLVEESVTARSPLERFDDLDPKLKEKWEDELAAAIEAEYRRQRGDVLAALQVWLRDVWILTLRLDRQHLMIGSLAEQAEVVARRLSLADATGNLEVVERIQRLLFTNVQEALALEVGLLRLKL